MKLGSHYHSWRSWIDDVTGAVPPKDANNLMSLRRVLVLSAMVGSLSCAPGVPGDYEEVVSGVTFTMKGIPGGSYLRGCVPSVGVCADVSNAPGPATHADVEAFYLAATETTWDLYQLCIEDQVCPDNEPDGGDNGWGKDDRPVIEVSWNDVVLAFIPWLNRKTGRTYRLPDEIEWEYAARATTTTPYHWGNEIDCARARFGYSTGVCDDPLGPLPVKSFEPNAFGLFDMLGNVWEFMNDCWTDPSAAGRPSADLSCRESVLRGGSWLNSPEELHVGFRFRHDRTFRESGDGFRLARSID